MTDVLRFNFCTVHIYDIYLIVEIDENVIITPTHNDVLENVVDTYYKNKPFVYISKRTYEYSVEPDVYNGTEEIENLKGFAVVSDNIMMNEDPGLIKLFKNKPFEYFSTVETAIEWAHALILE